MSPARSRASGKPGADKAVQAALATPAEIELTGAAGAAAVAELTLANTGDAPLALAAEGVATFRAAGALARGIREGFVATGGDLAGRLIALGRVLEAEPSLEVAYRLEADGDTLAPGAAAAVRIHFEIPESAAPRQTWTARLPLFGAGLQATLKTVARKGK
jgi:hypothetical protein